MAVVRRGGGDGVGGEVVRRRRAERRRRPGRLVEPEVGGGVAGRRGEALRRHGRCQPWGEGYGDGIHAAASAPHAQSPPAAPGGAAAKSCGTAANSCGRVWCGGKPWPPKWTGGWTCGWYPPAAYSDGGTFSGETAPGGGPGT